MARLRREKGRFPVINFQNGLLLASGGVGGMRSVQTTSCGDFRNPKGGTWRPPPALLQHPAWAPAGGSGAALPPPPRAGCRRRAAPRAPRMPGAAGRARPRRAAARLRGRPGRGRPGESRRGLERGRGSPGRGIAWRPGRSERRGAAQVGLKTRGRRGESVGSLNVRSAGAAWPGETSSLSAAGLVSWRG